MLEAKQINQIQEIIEEFFERMGFSLKVMPRLVLESGTESLIFKVSIKDAQESALLIGRFGSHLRALHYFLRIFVSSRLGQGFGKVCFLLDVNNYLENHKLYLQKLTLSAARRAVKFKKKITLEPMDAFDRRIVHLFLSQSKKVSTISQGKEPSRRVVIKPL